MGVSRATRPLADLPCDGEEAVADGSKTQSNQARPYPKAVLRLPDLDQAKSAVLNSLSSPDAQRGYRHAMDGFIERSCSEPWLSFSRTECSSRPDRAT